MNTHLSSFQSGCWRIYDLTHGPPQLRRSAVAVDTLLYYCVVGLVLHDRYMLYYYYVTVLHLSGYSVNGHFSVRVRVRVWYYFILRDRYMK